MPVETLTYETPQFLHKLIGNDLGSLRLVGETFGVNVISREGWVRIEGEDAGVASGTRGFHAARACAPAGR
jgi:phosphate starvation-inducible PhoH-like protein